MKSSQTLTIELVNLDTLIKDGEFIKAESLVTRMLNDYNNLDAQLLLKRARIKQYLLKYEEAKIDANIALNC